MAQTLFELHLDVYALIKNPGSGVPHVTQVLQKDRLERWSNLANSAVYLRTSATSQTEFDDLVIRHLWASAFHISVCDDVAKQHVVACMEELKQLLLSREEPVLLQNNAVMPELSVDAAERELSKINMKDFFYKVFDHNEKDPVSVIENLEPILESRIPTPTSKSASAVDTANVESHERQSNLTESTSENLVTGSDSPHRQMSRFLENGNVNLKLNLWNRLREAYEAIDYPPKVASCYLRSIELLLHEIKSVNYTSLPRDQRPVLLLRYIRIIDEYVAQFLLLAKNTTGALECVDEEHLRTSMHAVSEFSRLLHTFNLYEDSVRVGQVPPPSFQGIQQPTFVLIANKLHEIQIRTWFLQYILMQEAMLATPDTFPISYHDKQEYLRAVHHSTGIRGFCSASDHTLLILLRDELLQFPASEAHDIELAQVLQDLYGLKCTPNPQLDLWDHKCFTPLPLKTETASLLLDYVMAQANKVKNKDFPKSEIRSAIDKVHMSLGKQKPTDELAFNRMQFNRLIKGPIRPKTLIRCLVGESEVASKVVRAEDAPAASKGWFSLMGTISLSKYKATKERNAAAGPEDLNIATAFFTQDLEYDMNRWETWYNLAQTQDLQLDDQISHDAEKLNSPSHEILWYQRAAIHCYTMAVSCAVRCEDDSINTQKQMANMYHDFAMRIYSSSREPFCMTAFQFKPEEIKFFSDQIGNTLYTKYPFTPMTVQKAWHFANLLCREATQLDPDQWTYYYLLGKCQWKMYENDVSPPYIEARDVVDSFVRAVEYVPTKRDSRSNKPPTLEPHYKLVSIVHKLVQRKALSPPEGSDILQTTHFARRISKSTEADTWDEYVLQILKALRKADEANWHHRMVLRAAHVIYDECQENDMAAMAAKHELTQQVFTKTMAASVWRPEHERVGRHFVYTSRYVRFFMRLLLQLADKANMELLVRRVRRKTAEFFEHAKLWQD
ncbi:hypothetical protein LTS18_006730, partial [Coniosporium uncinatum]